MVECEVCFEDYQEGDLELHRVVCGLRFMFRCSLCHGDYLSKEGLWNHLDLHEIEDDRKESHYEELKVKCKLRQCALCNDQRAYSESFYWTHVQDVHDGFLLRCSSCGKLFRSEKLMNDHVLSNCEVSEETVIPDIRKELPPIEIKREILDAEHSKQSLGEQSSNAKVDFFVRLSEHSSSNLLTSIAADSHISNKECEMPSLVSVKNEILSQRFDCDICGLTFSTEDLLLRHKRSKLSCMQGKLHKCLRCGRVFRKAKYKEHMPECQKKRFKFACTICPRRFQISSSLTRHLKAGHCRRRNRKSEKEDSSYVKSTGKTMNPLDKPTTRSGNKIVKFNSESCSSSNVVEYKDVSLVKTITASKSLPSVVENRSSTECTYCNKECNQALLLHRHIIHSHEPIECDICGINFQGLSKVRYHKFMKHTDPKHECSKCLRRFHFKQIYMRHLDRCDYGNQDSSNDQKTFVPTAVNLAIEVSGTTCPHCGIEESCAFTLGRHILTYHDPVACDICGHTLPSLSAALQHIATVHENSNLKCPHCSMHFKSRMRHMKHAGKCNVTQIVCEFCGCLFENITAANKHKIRNCRQNSEDLKEQMIETTGEFSVPDENSKEATCGYCNEEFSSVEHLNNHLRSYHELSKCSICEMTVIGITEFKYHKVKQHRNLKYECPTCGKKFHIKNRFEVHSAYCARTKCNRVDIYKRYHKKPSEETTTSTIRDDGQPLDSQVVAQKPWIPASSGRGRRRYSSNHPSINTCNICGKTFATPNQISYHMLTRHTEEKFKCPKCPRKFHIKRRFEDHAVNCAGPVLTCEICGKEFKQWGRLENHKKRVHDHRNSGERTDSVEEMASADERMKQMPADDEQVKEHDSSQSGAEEVSSIQVSKKAKTDCTISLRNRKIVRDDSAISIPTELIKREKRQRYKCQYCGKKYCFEKKLNAHYSSCKRKISKELNLIEGHRENAKIKAEKITTTDSDSSSGSTFTQDKKSPEKESSKSVLENLPTQCYSCNVCEITFSSHNQMNYHILTRHTEGKFPCSRCPKKFHVKISLEKHAASCPGLKRTCEFCGQHFKLRGRLENHMRQAHASKLKNEGADKIEVQQQQNKAASTDELKVEYKIKNEMKTSATGTSESERQAIEDATMQSFVKNPSIPGYQCSICGVVVSSHDKISYHVLIKHTEPNYECPHCTRKFHLRRRLVIHLDICARLKHVCELCGQKYYLLSLLEIHKEQDHGEKSPNESVSCTKEQTQNRVDTAKETISCIICKVSFASTDELMKHKLNCHSRQTTECDDSQSQTALPMLVGNIELKLEFEEEDTVLQENDEQV